MPVNTRVGQTTHFGGESKVATPTVQFGRAKVLGALALLLQFTQADTALAVVIGITSQQLVTAGTALLSATYIALNFHKARRVLFDGFMSLWIFAIFILPVALTYIHLFIGSISPYFAYYWAAKFLSAVLLFSTAVVFSYSESRKAVIHILVASVLLIWLGYFVQMINFDFVRSMLRFRSVAISDFTVQGRAIGFFGHPNKFAVSILLYSSLIALFYAGYRKWALVLVFSLSAGIGVLLSGSRTSLLLLGVLTLITLTRFLLSSKNSTQFSVRYSAAFSFIILLFLVAWWAVSLGKSGGSVTLELGLERIERLLGALAGEDTDASLEIRGQTVVWFFMRSLEAPFLGLGPQATQQAIQFGLQPNVSQNSWVQWMYEFGIFYTVFVGFAFIKTFVSAKRIGNMHSQAKESADVTRTLIWLTLISMFSINGIFTVEAILSSLALALGALMRDRCES